MTLPKREGVPAGPRHARARWAAATALVLVACLFSQKASFGEPARAVLVGTGGWGSPLPASPPGGASARPLTGTFRIAGSAAKLYPGATIPLVLKVTNPESFVIVVTSLTVKVGGASAKCTASNLSASAFAGKLSVPAHGTALATLHLSMHRSALDGCEGAKFPLTYSGLARKA